MAGLEQWVQKDQQRGDVVAENHSRALDYRWLDNQPQRIQGDVDKPNPCKQIPEKLLADTEGPDRTQPKKSQNNQIDVVVHFR